MLLWQFPTAVINVSDTLHKTASQHIRNSFGKSLVTLPFGRSPIGHLEFRFPRKVRKAVKCSGAQIFFHHFLYLSGDVKLDTQEVVDFAWVTRDEFQHYFTPEWLAAAQSMLPP